MADIRIFDLVTQLNPSTNDFLPITNGANTNKVPVDRLPVNYNNLTNKPTIPAAQVQTDWNASSGITAIANKPSLASVATSGDYNSLSNKPGAIQAYIKFRVSGYVVTTLASRNIQSVTVNAPGTRGAQTVDIRVTGVSLGGLGFISGGLNAAGYTTQADRMLGAGNACTDLGSGIYRGAFFFFRGGNEVDGGAKVQCGVNIGDSGKQLTELNFIYVL